jgi:hypothetical protein
VFVDDCVAIFDWLFCEVEVGIAFDFITSRREGGTSLSLPPSFSKEGKLYFSRSVSC